MFWEMLFCTLVFSLSLLLLYVLLCLRKRCAFFTRSGCCICSKNVRLLYLEMIFRICESLADWFDIHCELIFFSQSYFRPLYFALIVYFVWHIFWRHAVFHRQQQPGLISRVTDTVKSIVPSWLQKYFRNGEVAEGETTPVGLERNNVAPPPNGNEDTTPLPDGRDSPEPSTSHMGMLGRHHLPYTGLIPKLCLLSYCLVFFIYLLMQQFWFEGLFSFFHGGVGVLKNHLQAEHHWISRMLFQDLQ